MEVVEENNINLDYVQLCGFKIGDGFYAVPVLEVQEVVRPQKITQVPMAPDYIEGLINLRGQVVTSINLRTLFKLEGDDPDDFMNVIVRSRDSLYALVVDEILDVIDVPNKSFEETPDTLDDNLRKYIEGVYKLKDRLLISLSIEKLINVEE
jgi:purine-binding chemotaxis protein CheW